MRKEILGVSFIIVVLFGLTLANVSIASPEPIVSVNPQPISKQTGMTFDINITVADVTDLYGWQLNVTFDPSVLNCTGFEEGPFLKQAGTTWPLPTTIDNDGGFVFAGSSLFPPPPTGASGNGTLATITFKAIAVSQTYLNFSESKLNGWDNDVGIPVPIPHTAVDGTIQVTIPGDVNGDRTVNIFDIGTISAHWYPGPPIGPLGYDENADINQDGAVNIFDIGITSAYWGQSW